MYDQRLKNSKQGNWIIWTISSVAFDNDELLVEDSFDDKLAPIMLQSSLTKHLLKADILFRREFEIIPVDSGICRCRASDPLFWTCHIVGCKVAWLGNATRPRRASTFRMPKIFSAYEGTARCFLAKTKIRGGKFFVKTLKSLRYGLQGRVCSRCNITTVRAPKQTLGADWSGLERTSEPRYFSRLYLAAWKVGFLIPFIIPI